MAQQTLLQDCLDLLGEAITSGDTAYTTAIFDDIANNGVRYIFMKLPREALMQLAIQQTAFAPSTGIVPQNTQIVEVLRNDGSFDRTCVEVSQRDFALAADPRSIYRATALIPVYTREAQTTAGVKVKVAPNGTASLAKLIDVSYPVIANSTSKLGAITGFPDELGDALLFYCVGSMLQREANLSRRTAQDEIEAITSGILSAVDITLAEVETALDTVTTKLAASSITSALSAITAASQRINIAVTRANTEFDKVVVASTGPLALANVEFDKISALLDLGEADSEASINGGLALISTALSKVAAIIVEASAEIDIAVTEAATMYTSGSGSADITAFGTAISDAQTDFDFAISILGGASPETNAVDDIHVAGTVTSPADQDVIQLLTDRKLDAARIALGLGDARIKEAAGHISGGSAKITEARAQLDNWSAQWGAVGQQAAISDKFLAEAKGYIEEAGGHAAEIQTRLAQATTKRQEGASRISSGGAFLTEAGARIESGNAYLREAEKAAEEARSYALEVGTLLSHPAAYLQEVQGRLAKVSALMSKAGARLQSATDIESRGKDASDRGDSYLLRSDKIVAEYSLNFPSGVQRASALQGGRR